MIIDITKKNFLTSNQSKKINELAYNLRYDYNKLITSYSKGFKIDQYYWSSEIPSRNSNNNNLFQNICFLFYIINLVSKDRSIKKIIVDDKSIDRILSKYFKKKHIKIEILNKQSSIELIQKKIYPFLKYLQNLFIIIKCLFFSFVTKIKFSSYKLKKNLILIDSFIIDESVKNKEFNDLYYNKFLNFLNKKEKKNLYYVPSFVNITDYYKDFFNFKKIWSKIYF